MTDKAFHIRPVDGGWVVFARADERLCEPLRARADAVVHAKELARKEGLAQILVYGDDGKLDSEFFYGQDERPELAFDDSVGSLAATRPEHRVRRESR